MPYESSPQPADAIRWVEILNADTAPCPPFGVCAPAGLDAATGAIKIQRPTADGMTGVLFAGMTGIPPGGRGVATTTAPVVGAYQVSSAKGSDPAAGEAWGTKAGSWYLQPGKTGFQCLGGSFEGLSNWIPSAPSSGKDLNYFRQPGPGGGMDVYYAGAPVAGTGAGVAFTPTANQVYAAMLPSGRGGTLDKVGFWLNAAGAAGVKARVAVYETVSDSDLYPGALLLDSGDIAADTGAPGYRLASVSLALPADKAVWFAFNLGSTSGSPTFGAVSQNNTYVNNYVGFPASGFVMANILAGALTYGAFPATFPAGIPPVNSNFFPLVMIHYSG